MVYEFNINGENLRDDEILKIKSAKQAVKLAKFQKLVKELHKLSRSIKKVPLALDVIVDSLLKIIEKYPLEWENYEEITPLVTIRNYQEIKPEIIISESFDNNGESLFTTPLRQGYGGQAEDTEKDGKK
jgi:hypothetical protein